MSQQAIVNPHLQLCVNDLLYPTEKSESLLEALTTAQLDDIERTLIKIKEKKLSLCHKKQKEEEPAVTKEKSSSDITPPTPVTTTANPTNLHHDWTLVAAQIAKALADSITTTVNTNKLNTTKPPSKSAIPHSTTTTTTITNTTSIPHPTPSTPIIPSPSTSNTTITEKTILKDATKSSPDVVPNHEPSTEIKDGVEWVSFVYSHHRVLRRYSIRTDVDKVDITGLDDKFKSENCVYPRANLPREEYKGNRWAYETECNTLGWKLAYLNSSEIAGKRGLIQRAVDSYRNRYPSMRSRRVARQEKLLKGTLRKRKQRESDELEDTPHKVPKQPQPTQEEPTVAFPKTVSIDDGVGSKHRIRINVDSVSLDAIDLDFRKANCVYPRALNINPHSPFASQRQIEEAKCNELAWKLAWLNPKQLTNRKNLLQRVLDVYRNKFLPELNPRKNSLRMPNETTATSTTTAHASIDTNMLMNTNNAEPSLTVTSFSAQQQELEAEDEPIYNNAADALHFHDCFSPSHSSPSLSEDSNSSMLLSPTNIMLSAPTSSDDLLTTTTDCIGVTKSPFEPSPEDHVLFKNTSMFDLYQLPSIGVDFEHSDYIKSDQDNLIDPLMTQLFHI